MNVLQLIRDIQAASEAGKQIANPATWANRASLILAIVSVLQVSLMLVNEFLPEPIVVSDIDIQTIGELMVIVGMFIANKLHISANLLAGKKSPN